jgi:Ca-activated chloride channel family protein
VWATRKIGYLLDEIRLRGERAELRDEVVTLSRRFGIVTPYTSYLVAPDSEYAAVRVPEAREETRVWRRPPPDMPMSSSAPEPATRAAAPAAAARDFESFDAASVGAARSGGGAPSAPAAAAPSGGMGDGGRRLSARLRTMREAERAGSDEGLTARFVAGRTFTRSGAGWSDARYRSGMRVLRLRAMGVAYFAVLRARPELAAAFALGDAVTVALDAERAVIVDPSAPDVSADEVARFLR